METEMVEPKTYFRGRQTNYGWLVEHSTYGGDDCLTWPFSRHGEGYGSLGVGPYTRKAHHVMCRIVHGEPPTIKHVAAHSCGNGHLGCVNPKHISWKTHQENMKDKILHGRTGGGRGTRTSLTAAQIAEIRASKGLVNAAIVGKKYGLTRAGVRYWQNTTHEPLPPGSSYATIMRRKAKAEGR